MRYLWDSVVSLREKNNHSQVEFELIAVDFKVTISQKMKKTKLTTVYGKSSVLYIKKVCFPCKVLFSLLLFILFYIIVVPLPVFKIFDIASLSYYKKTTSKYTFHENVTLKSYIVFFYKHY
jgi:hypothetical protein